jgi:hypothetical protein
MMRSASFDGEELYEREIFTKTGSHTRRVLLLGLGPAGG